VRIGITASYLQQRTREVVGVTIAFKDLNEMRSLRARLQQAEQLAALGTVTAGVAHEIRNPLASLRGLTELLGRDVHDGDPRRTYVDTMLEAIAAEGRKSDTGRSQAGRCRDCLPDPARLG
jgi:signal transduction histidine kinase